MTISKQNHLHYFYKFIICITINLYYKVVFDKKILIYLRTYIILICFIITQETINSQLKQVDFSYKISIMSLLFSISIFSFSTRIFRHAICEDCEATKIFRIKIGIYERQKYKFSQVLNLSQVSLLIDFDFFRPV